MREVDISNPILHKIACFNSGDAVKVVRKGIQASDYFWSLLVYPFSDSTVKHFKSFCVLSNISVNDNKKLSLRSDCFVQQMVCKTSYVLYIVFLIYSFYYLRYFRISH